MAARPAAAAPLPIAAAFGAQTYFQPEPPPPTGGGAALHESPDLQLPPVV